MSASEIESAPLAPPATAQGSLADPLAVDYARRFLFLGHLYFLFTFHDWRNSLDSFSRQGRDALIAIPIGLFQTLPRADALVYEGALWLLCLLSLAGLLLALQEKLAWSRHLLLVALLAKLGLYLQDLGLFAPYHHMHLLLTGLFLVSSSQRLFLRLGLATIYLCAGLGKFTPSWLAGEYFNSVPGRLPWFPQHEGLVTALSLAVVVLECLGPWLWFSSSAKVRYAAVVAFTLFHLYSGLLVGFFFPALMLPMLWLAFCPFEHPLLQGYRFRRADAGGWALLGLALLGSLWPHLLRGDVRLTGEGRYLSISNMFDANRSISFEAALDLPEGQMTLRVERQFSSVDFYQVPTRVSVINLPAGIRQELLEPLQLRGQTLLDPMRFGRLNVRLIGDPYVYYQWMEEVWRRFQPTHFSGQLYEWLDGHKTAYRIFYIRDFRLDRPDYSPFLHNEWLEALPLEPRP